MRTALLSTASHTARPSAARMAVVGEILPRRTLAQRVRADLHVAACHARWQRLRAHGVPVIGASSLTPNGCTKIITHIAREHSRGARGVAAPMRTPAA